MTGSNFTRIGGLGALLGGTSWVASFGAAQAISPDLKGIIVGPVLLMLLGLAALQARHATGSGKLGKAGFGLTLIGLVLLAYGSVGRAVISGDLAGIAYGPLVFAGVAPGRAGFCIRDGSGHYRQCYRNQRAHPRFGRRSAR